MLAETLAETLAEMQAETLADTLAETLAETLGETDGLRCVVGQMVVSGASRRTRPPSALMNPISGTGRSIRTSRWDGAAVLRHTQPDKRRTFVYVCAAETNAGTSIRTHRVSSWPYSGPAHFHRSSVPTTKGKSVSRDSADPPSRPHNLFIRLWMRLPTVTGR